MIPVEGNIFLTLHTETEIVYMVLTSINQNNSRVMILASAFVVTNYTIFPLQMWPFAIQSDRVELIPKNQFEQKSYQTLCCNENKQVDVMGDPIQIFKDLSKLKGKRKFGAIYNFFVSLSFNGNEFSCPIFLNKPIIRKCFSMQIEGKSVCSFSILLI